MGYNYAIDHTQVNYTPGNSGRLYILSLIHILSRNDLSSEYSYNPVVYVSTEVKSIMDGKEVGRGSAPYVKAENDRITKVKQKINGIR